MRPLLPPGPLVIPLQAWFSGDLEPLRQALRDLESWPLPWVDRIYWEICTLLGQPLQPPSIVWGDHIFPPTLHYRMLYATGGPPQHLLDAPALGERWGRLLEPPSLARHALGLRRSLALLRNGDPWADLAAAVLRHHTDLPTDFFDGRQPISPDGSQAELRLEVERLAHLEWADLNTLIREGAMSTSLPRRDLCYRLSHLGSTT